MTELSSVSGLRGVREAQIAMRDACFSDMIALIKICHEAVPAGTDGKEALAALYESAEEKGVEGFGAALSLPPSPQAANEHDAIQVVSHERDEAVAAVLKLIAELRKRDISVQDHNAKFGGDIHVVTGEHQRTAFFSKEAAEEYLAKQDPEVFKIVVYAKPVGEQRELTAEQAEKIDEIISRHKTDAFDSFHAADDLSDYLFGGINYPGIFAVHRAPAGAQGQVQGVQARVEAKIKQWRECPCGGPCAEFADSLAEVLK